ncbi:NTP transferase domain-containing protein [Halosegnis sp.]|uniref:NTP transferase domain-containing protein n=1 Tax=Halosegnis sp. TaxID=2864959 RepID=UPI0035D4D267
MDALVMCGGRGTRLGAAVEKPLYEVGGEPMIERVLAALDGSAVETVHAVASPDTPNTRTHLAERGRSVVDGTGDGYVADLDRGLSVVGRPALTVVADLPLLAPTLVDRAVTAHDGRNVTICVPTRLKDRLGVSAERTRDWDGRRLSPTGLNVVGDGDGERVEQTWDARAAVNVNYETDAAVAEALV